jgi:hypothetical protein
MISLVKEANTHYHTHGNDVYNCRMLDTVEAFDRVLLIIIPSASMTASKAAFFPTSQILTRIPVSACGFNHLIFNPR